MKLGIYIGVPVFTLALSWVTQDTVIFHDNLFYTSIEFVSFNIVISFVSIFSVCCNVKVWYLFFPGEKKGVCGYRREKFFASEEVFSKY